MNVNLIAGAGRSLVLGLLTLLVCMAGGGCEWVKVSPGGPNDPTARSGHAMAFDSIQGHVMLFGGVNPSNPKPFNAETWEWNDSSSSWVKQTTAAAPQPRAFHAMASDPDRHVVVLFGGTDGATDFGDTWEWDGNHWTGFPQQPDGPKGRQNHAMAYDAARKQVVMFGGVNTGTSLPPTDPNYVERQDFDDTWFWKGGKWIKGPAGPPGPSARDGHRMAYGGQQAVVLMYGGTQDVSTFKPLPETWQWDGTWTQVSAAPPPAIIALAATSFGPVPGVVMFGGFDGKTTFYDDTVVWDGTQWLMTNFTTRPDKRKDHAMAYDPTTGNLVMFGGVNGSGLFGDTWELKKKPVAQMLHRGVPIKFPPPPH
jgi:hypothetical protein